MDGTDVKQILRGGLFSWFVGFYIKMRVKLLSLGVANEKINLAVKAGNAGFRIES